jgi:hypothetical protein
LQEVLNSQKLFKKNEAGKVAQVVDRLPSKCKALSSKPSATKKKKKKKKKKRNDVEDSPLLISKLTIKPGMVVPACSSRYKGGGAGGLLQPRNLRPAWAT